MQGLLFPLPTPNPDLVGRLLLFFDRLTGYRPTEDPSPAGPVLPGAEELWRTYTPAPLGEDLARFNRLVRDMTQNLSAYRHAYLKGLAEREERGETEWTALSSFIRQGAAVPVADPGLERLWRARLVLFLAEQHAAAEREIHNDLAAVAGRETELFKMLQGDLEGDEGIPSLPAVSSPPAERLTSFEARKLLTAWGQLFLADCSPDRPRLLVTVFPEAVEIIKETCGRMTGATPEPLFSLSLPNFSISPGPTYLKERERFRQAVREPLATLTACLQEAAAGTAPDGLPPAASAKAAAARWEEIAAGIFPPEKVPQGQQRPEDRDRLLLTCYRLAGKSWPELFQHLSGVVSSRTTAQPSRAILAVLGPGEGGGVSSSPLTCTDSP